MREVGREEGREKRDGEEWRVEEERGGREREKLISILLIILTSLGSKYDLASMFSRWTYLSC